MKKVYGMVGLMECVTQIKVGKARIELHFTGGFPTAYGVSAARYTTDNPVVQKAIENSAEFKRGKIVLLKKYPSPQVESVVKSKVNPMPEPEQKTSEPEQTIDAPKEETSDETKLKEIEVGCLQDAAAYLKENHGVATRNVTGVAKAQEIGKMENPSADDP